MISRLVVSLRKATDGSIVRIWDGDRFASVSGNGEYEMDFVGKLPPPTPLSPFARQGSKRSSGLDFPSFRSEA